MLRGSRYVKEDPGHGPKIDKDNWISDVQEDHSIAYQKDKLCDL